MDPVPGTAARRELQRPELCGRLRQGADRGAWYLGHLPVTKRERRPRALHPRPQRIRETSAAPSTATPRPREKVPEFVPTGCRPLSSQLPVLGSFVIRSSSAFSPLRTENRELIQLALRSS